MSADGHRTKWWRKSSENLSSRSLKTLVQCDCTRQDSMRLRSSSSRDHISMYMYRPVHASISSANVLFSTRTVCHKTLRNHPSHVSKETTPQLCKIWTLKATPSELIIIKLKPKLNRVRRQHKLSTAINLSSQGQRSKVKFKDTLCKIASVGLVFKHG